ncbi:MAG: hypothetical protein FWF23_05690, partial [Alphaproteobacteria bacterium]|nr:hypothetical protein [Alphaproteobacteria bacterium]
MEDNLHSSIKNFEKKHNIEGLSVDYVYPDNMSREQFCDFFYDKIHKPLFVLSTSVDRNCKTYSVGELAAARRNICSKSFEEYTDYYADTVITLKRQMKPLFKLNPELAKVDRSGNSLFNLDDNDIRKIIKEELQGLDALKKAYKDAQGDISTDSEHDIYSIFVGNPSALIAEINKNMHIAMGTLYHFPPCDIDWFVNGREALNSSQRQEHHSLLLKAAQRFGEPHCCWIPSPK